MTRHEEHRDVVRLASAANPAQAHIWKQALQDEGIRSEIVGEYLDAGLGDIPGLYPELWVYPEDLERAKELLRRHEGTASEESGEENE
jgi:hypothetical protein